MKGTETETSVKFARKAQQDLGLLDSSDESQESNRPITSLRWKRCYRMAPKKTSTPLQVIGTMPQLTPEAQAYMESNQMNLDAACMYSFVFMKYPPLHKEQVVEFVKNWTSANGGLVNVAGKSVEFTPEALAQLLRLHGDGPVLSQVKPLPKKTLMEVLGKDVMEAKK